MIGPAAEVSLVEVMVISPDVSILPVPVILLEFISKFPPSCGVVSSTTLFIDTAWASLSVYWVIVEDIAPVPLLLLIPVPALKLL